MLLSFAAITAVLAVVGILGVTSSQTMKVAQMEVLHRASQVDSAMEAKNAIGRSMQMAMELLAAENSAELNTAMKKYQGFSAVFDENNNALLNGGTVDGTSVEAMENPAALKKIRDADSLHNSSFDPAIHKISAAKSEMFTLAGKADVTGEKLHRLEAQLHVFDKDADDAGEKILATMTEVEGMASAVLDETADASMALADQSQFINMVALALGIILAVGIGVFLTRSLVIPIKQITGIANNLAKGDVHQKMEIHRKDEIGELANAFGELMSLLQTRARAAEQYAEGNLTQKIDVVSSQDVLGEAMARMRRTISNLIQQINHMSNEHDAGDIDVQIPVTDFRGAYAEMADGINKMVNGHIAVKKKAMACVKEFGQGNFDAPLEKFPGKKAFINETIEAVRGSIKKFIADMNHMSHEHDAGDIDVQIPANEFTGSFREMAEGVNNMVNGHIAVKKKAMACVKEFGQGNFDAPLEKFPGKKAFINETIEAVRSQLKATSAEVQRLIDASKAGQLSERGEYQKFTGGWRAMVQGINELLDTILDPIGEASDVLEQLANYNLTARVKGNYQGDHARIKNALNTTGEVLHDAIAQVQQAVGQVNSAAQQISVSSQQVAEGASEQASSLEETTSSMEEMSGMTKQNADNTRQAQTLAEETRAAANKGTGEMGRMVDAMGKIKTSAQRTAEIIKDINDIAFQTNLLALNAAVEAARAGDAGRGFAVVAEEVRNLAGRAKDAAQNTESLIKESVTLAETGEKISGDVNENLNSMVVAIQKVTDIISEITVASSEQARGIEQVNRAMVEMDQVTQRSAANSEESSSAAEELAGQAEELMSLVSRFRLDSGMQSQSRIRPTSPPVNDRAKRSKRHNRTENIDVPPHEMMPMDDDPDFAEF